jgi:hypothetical protein
VQLMRAASWPSQYGPTPPLPLAHALLPLTHVWAGSGKLHAYGVAKQLVGLEVAAGAPDAGVSSSTGPAKQNAPRMRARLLLRIDVLASVVAIHAARPDAGPPGSRLSAPRYVGQSIDPGSDPCRPGGVPQISA